MLRRARGSPSGVPPVARRGSAYGFPEPPGSREGSCSSQPIHPHALPRTRTVPLNDSVEHLAGTRIELEPNEQLFATIGPPGEAPELRQCQPARLPPNVRYIHLDDEGLNERTCDGNVAQRGHVRESLPHEMLVGVYGRNVVADYRLRATTIGPFQADMTLDGDRVSTNNPGNRLRAPMGLAVTYDLLATGVQQGRRRGSGSTAASQSRTTTERRPSRARARPHQTPTSRPAAPGGR